MTLKEIKASMNRTVLYKGGEYRLVGCIFRQNAKTGDYYYQAELLDLTSGRSTVICKLVEVERQGALEALLDEPGLKVRINKKLEEVTKNDKIIYQRP